MLLGRMIVDGSISRDVMAGKFKVTQSAYAFPEGSQLGHKSEGLCLSKSSRSSGRWVLAKERTTWYQETCRDTKENCLMYKLEVFPFFGYCM